MLTSFGSCGEMSGASTADRTSAIRITAETMAMWLERKRLQANAANERCGGVCAATRDPWTGRADSVMTLSLTDLDPWVEDAV